MEVNVHEAKTHLSRLLERVALGDEITIMKANVPIARLVPIGRKPARRRLGWSAGEIKLPADFDDPLPTEIEDTFYR